MPFLERERVSRVKNDLVIVLIFDAVIRTDENTITPLRKVLPADYGSEIFNDK